MAEARTAGQGPGRLLPMAALGVAELLVIIAVYQVFVSIECRLTEVESACRVLRSMPARGLAAAAALALFFGLRRDTFRTLTALAQRRPPAPLWLALHGLGAALIFLPLLQFGAAGLNSHFLPALLIMSLGGLLAAAGGLFWAVAPRDWLRWLRSSGPALMLVLAGALLVPDAATLLEPLWYISALTDITFALVHLILAATGAGVWADPSIHVIGLDGFNVRIGSPCSGVEGLALVTAFMGFYAVLMRGSLRQRRFWLLLYPLALLVSWLFNITRIAGLIMIGAWVSPEHALNGFHSYAGWLMFTLLALAVLVVMHRMSWLQAGPAQGTPEAPLAQDPVAARILPFIAMMVSGIIAASFWINPAEGYPLRCLIMAAALLWMLPALRQIDWRFGGADLLAGIIVGIAWIVSAPAAAAPAAAAAGPAWMLFRILGTTLLVPVIEELFFRGYLLARLDSRGTARRAAALFLSSLLFGLMHERIGAGLLAGIVFGILMLRSGRLGSPVAAHVCANAMIAAWAAITSNWQLI